MFNEESFSRRYAELTVDLKGWGLSRIYGDPSQGGRMKHLIEPTFRYQYRTGIDRFDRILRFDHLDSITDTNEVEYGLFNRFFVKRRTPHGSQTHELLALKLVQKHFLDPDFGGAFRAGAVNQFLSFHSLTGFPFGGLRRGFSPITAVARVTPEPVSISTSAPITTPISTASETSRSWDSSTAGDSFWAPPTS